MTRGSPDEESTRESPAAPVRRWGSLELREPLGQGAFGTVYRAWDPKLAKDVALKILESTRVRQSDDPLLTEARRLAQIRHPHVVTVYGADVNDGQVGFWMELIRGVTLEQHLRRGAMGPQEAAWLGTAMAQALAAVHGSGVVHGDVKARNIMREEGGRYVLTDFGASSDLAAVSGAADAAVIGTPLYMAPEVLAGGRPSHASDIYSLGVLLFHCVTREYPVAGATMAEVRAAHGRGDRRLLRDVRPDLPASFVQVVERALAVEPEARFSTAGAFEHALAALAGATTRRGLTWGLVGAVAVLAIVAGVSWFGRPSGTPAPGGAADIRTVAVLPFEHDGTPGREAFSRGLTDLLTARLCEVASLRVVSQTSARQVRVQAMSLPDAARALGVDDIIEGSIHGSGARVRIDVRLIRASTDSIVWSQSFENDDADLLRMQAALALAVGKQLRQALTPSEQQRLASVETTSPAAQDELLQGWAAMESPGLEGTRSAIRHFEAATRLDPNYARAHAVLSHAYWYLGVGLNAMPRQESEAKATASARRALALDPGLPRAHSALAQLEFYFNWNWAAAETGFEKAVALNPSDADAHQQYGWFLAARGHGDRALDQMKRARELDPLSYTRRSPVAAVLYYSGRYDAAIQELQDILAINPRFVPAQVGLVRVYAALGRTDDALRQLEGPARSDSAWHFSELGRIHAQAGRLTEASAHLATLEARRAAAPDSVPFDALAILYAALGRTREALDLVEQAHAARLPALVWLKVDPRYDPLRTQPRFISVLRQMGLTS